MRIVVVSGPALARMASFKAPVSFSRIIAAFLSF
jgi:hypothetical protein